MNKLKLDPDRLEVQSFDPAPDGAAARGTVRGHGTHGIIDSCAASWCFICSEDPEAPECNSGACPTEHREECSGGFSECCWITSVDTGC